MAKSAVAAPKSGLTWKHKIGYGLGDFGGCMTFALMGSYVTRYYVNVLKVDTVILATLLLIGCVLFVSLFAAHMVTGVNAYVHMIWFALANGISGVSIMMQWGLVGEAIDYNEYLTGKRTEGSIYGTFNLSRRIGQTVGNSAAVLALGWIGYDATLAAQSAGTLTGIKVLCVLVPGIFVIGSWIAFHFVWNITDETRAKMAAHFEAK